MPRWACQWITWHLGIDFLTPQICQEFLLPFQRFDRTCWATESCGWVFHLQRKGNQQPFVTWASRNLPEGGDIFREGRREGESRLMIPACLHSSMEQLSQFVALKQNCSLNLILNFRSKKKKEGPACSGQCASRNGCCDDTILLPLTVHLFVLVQLAPGPVLRGRPPTMARKIDTELVLT